MKKRVFGRKLGRERDSRRALFRSLVRSLFEHGQIKTTRAKAKAIQPEVDRILSIAKKGDITAQRRVFARLGNDKQTTKKAFSATKLAFKGRSSGFTRIVNLGARRGDNVEVVRLEFVENIFPPTPKKKETKKKTVKKAAKTKGTKKTKAKKEDK